jgi:hypothetical protein
MKSSSRALIIVSTQTSASSASIKLLGTQYDTVRPREALSATSSRVVDYIPPLYVGEVALDQRVAHKSDEP